MDKLQKYLQAIKYEANRVSRRNDINKKLITKNILYFVELINRDCSLPINYIKE